MNERKTVALATMVGRMGAESLQLRYSDDELPTIFMSVAKYGPKFVVGSGLDPERALVDLVEKLADGGTCTHCGRVTVFFEDEIGKSDRMAFDDTVCCLYGWNPALGSYERSCGAETN